MYPVLQKDIDKFSSLLQSVKDLSSSYLETINERVTSKSNPSFDMPALPTNGLGYIQTQQLFEERFLQNIVASSGPRYWGFVTGGSTPAAIAGDWITAVFDQNTQSATGNGDISAALELNTVKLLMQVFHCPENFLVAL